jgi:hypothetical protein
MPPRSGRRRRHAGAALFLAGAGTAGEFME